MARRGVVEQVGPATVHTRRSASRALRELRGGAMRKKVDQRIRTLVENCVKLHQRSMFVIVGDRGRDQARPACAARARPRAAALPRRRGGALRDEATLGPPHAARADSRRAAAARRRWSTCTTCSARRR